MKKYFLAFTCLFSSLSYAAPFTDNSIERFVEATLPRVEEKTAGDLITWHVGDYSRFNMTIRSNRSISRGTMLIDVDANEGDAVWLSETVDPKNDGYGTLIRVLIRRADGKVLRLLVNGQDSAPWHGEMTLLEERDETVDVPAGRFNAHYKRARHWDQGGTDQLVETWTVPNNEVELGLVREFVDMYQGATVDLELTAHGNDTTNLVK